MAIFVKQIRTSEGTQIHFSYGIHPLTVHNLNYSKLDQLLKDLETMAGSTRTVLTGECGLDISDKLTHITKQRDYFEKQLKLAVSMKLPVVIHCSGHNSTHKILLTTLINCCPIEHNIHWNCFTRSQEIYLSATAHFTNLVFGITPFILNNRYPNIKEVIKTNGIDKMVLESDSPFIPCRPNQLPNPYVINFVGAEISELIQIPIEKIFAVTFDNALKIYGKQK
jgi:TatD DNase family protein